LPDACERAAVAAAREFPVFAPLEYLARMRPGDPHDPLLRQILPLADELDDVPGFGDDPVGDEMATFAAGMLSKYRSRVLLVTTGACAVHCRYCFRRHFAYEHAPKAPAAWEPGLARIAATAEVDEVILSGGDPLTLVDTRLAELVARIQQIEHVRRLRIHTRLPIMIPSRVDERLLAWLADTRLTTILVIHANHAAELDDAVAHGLAALSDVGVTLLNQSVLLDGVNDDVETLVELSRRLVDLGVLPYYLHQLDRVRGAAHFEVPVDRGRALVEAMRSCLPGYAVPRYVQEIPGAPSKTVLA
jgi:EF-P beta-lysylation protein EpmB